MTKEQKQIEHIMKCLDCTEEEARDIADQMFSEEDDRKISASVAYYDICDCWELDQEEF